MNNFQEKLIGSFFNLETCQVAYGKHYKNVQWFYDIETDKKICKNLENLIFDHGFTNLIVMDDFDEDSINFKINLSDDDTDVSIKISKVIKLLRLKKLKKIQAL
jgi:hypothetical protein